MLGAAVDHIQRKDVHLIERANALKQILEEHPQIEKQDDLAIFLGKDKGWISNMLNIAESIPEELKQKVVSSQKPVSFDALFSIAREKNRDDQKKMINKLLNGATAFDIREEIKSKKSKTQRTKKVNESINYKVQEGITVVVKAKKNLTQKDIISALEQALDQARGTESSKTHRSNGSAVRKKS